MMGDGLSESGGGGESGVRRGGGCFKCKSLSYKNWFHLKGFLGNDPHFHGRGDKSARENSITPVKHQGDRGRKKRSRRKGYMGEKEMIVARVRPFR